jgi:hypothetical protein
MGVSPSGFGEQVTLLHLGDENQGSLNRDMGYSATAQCTANAQSCLKLISQSLQ